MPRAGSDRQTVGHVQKIPSFSETHSKVTEFFQVWRTNGLIRLYTAYLLFVLSDAMNPVKRTFTFEYWYIVYFHDIQLWEMKHRTGSASSDPVIYSNLVATNRHMARSSSLGATMSSSQDGNDAQVIEVIDRIISLAKVRACFFLATIHL